MDKIYRDIDLTIEKIIRANRLANRADEDFYSFFTYTEPGCIYPMALDLMRKHQISPFVCLSCKSWYKMLKALDKDIKAEFMGNNPELRHCKVLLLVSQDIYDYLEQKLPASEICRYRGGQ